MRIFKATYKDRLGAVRESKKWYVEFKCHMEIVHRWPLFSDKASSEEAGRKIDRLVSLRHAGEQIDTALTTWFETLTEDLRQKMQAVGLVSSTRVAAGRALSEHLAAFKMTLEATGCSKKHAQVTHSRAETVVYGCKMSVWQDVTADAVREWLTKEWRKKEFGAKTHNYYLRDMKAFCNWMVRSGRARENPLASLQGLSAKALKKELVNQRRALTVPELESLLTAASNSPETVFGVSGTERALIYLLAVETGLRAGEIGSLTRSCFHFNEKQSVVILPGGMTKNGKDAALPLRKETAEILHAHMANMLPAAKAFNIPPSYDTAEMIRVDLKTAGIKDTDGYLVVDFHSLRHTFITNLANSGIHPKVAQDLARHSDINLTMSRYSHTVLEQRAEAVAKLPALRTGVAVTVATGTAGPETAGDLSCRPACCFSAENGESQRTGTASVTYESTPAGVAEWQTQWIQNPPTSRS